MRLTRGVRCMWTGLAVLAMPKQMGSKGGSQNPSGQVGATLTNRSMHSRCWCPRLFRLGDDEKGDGRRESRNND